MDYRPLLSFHATSGAEMTIASVRRPTSEAGSLGVLETDHHAVTRFVEKPAPDSLFPAESVQASMGIYAFTRRCLMEPTATEASHGICLTAPHTRGREPHRRDP